MRNLVLVLVVGYCGWGCASSNSEANITNPAASAPAPTASVTEAPTSASTAPESTPQPTSVPPGPPPQVDEKSVGGSASPGATAGTRVTTPSAEAALQAGATGPATGGPRGSRSCHFHESVDAYARRCTITTAADGSLNVVAKGTPLNPEHGFEFSLHGGPTAFVAKGTLNAFGICKGPFLARVNAIRDRGRTIYELRFKEHCKITID